MNDQSEEPDRSEAIELLSRLVSTPSVNPQGADNIEPPYGEERVAKVVEDYLEALGIPSRRQEVFPGRSNVLATLEPTGVVGAQPVRAPGADTSSAPTEARTLIWEAHMDTCKVEGMAIPPFEPRVEGGRLFGRGACDAKGSLAAMLLALKMLSGRYESLRARVQLLASVDEEFSYAGVKKFVALGGRGDLAIVGEPTRLNLVVAHKGAVRWRIVTHGKAAHSSQPELGSNAIYKMARVVRAIEERVIPLYSSKVHPLLGTPTINVGTIEGGQQSNTVPDRCAISVDRRLLPGEEAAEAVEEVRQAVSQSLGEGASDVEFEPPNLVDPALDGSPNDPHALAAAEAARRVLPDLEIVGVHYGTDASKLALGGTPSLVFGPGDVACAHSAVEFVSIDEVMKAAQVYAQIALAMWHGAPHGICPSRRSK